MGQWWPAGELGAVRVAVHAWDLLKEVTVIFITSTVVWPQVNSREGTQVHSSTENWIKDLLSCKSGLEGKASACNAGDLGLIPGLGRSPGEGNGNPLQYSCLENPMDGGSW